MKANITLFVLAALLASSMGAAPFYAWTNSKIISIEAKREVLEPASAQQVALEIKAILDSDPAFSAVLFLRPNLETSTLPSLLANELPKTRGLIKTH